MADETATPPEPEAPPTEGTDDASSAGASVASKLMTTPTAVACSLIAVLVIPAAMTLYKTWKNAKAAESTLDDIFATDTAAESTPGEDGAPEDVLVDEATKNAPWPEQLPGADKIEAYWALKEELIDEDDDEIKPEANAKLRHALMDRCQVHVPWLVRLERQQNAMNNMHRRGLVKAKDFAVFKTFAEVCGSRVGAAWVGSFPAESTV